MIGSSAILHHLFHDPDQRVCEIALLCRLVCGRFVASSRHAAIDLGGIKIALNFRMTQPS